MAIHGCDIGGFVFNVLLYADIVLLAEAMFRLSYFVQFSQLIFLVHGV